MRSRLTQLLHQNPVTDLWLMRYGVRLKLGWTQCGFILPSPIVPPQNAVAIVALQARRTAGGWPLQGGEGLG